MPKQVGHSKSLRIFGPYPPGRGSTVQFDHLMIRVVGDKIDKTVYVDHDDLEPVIDVIRDELKKRLAARRARIRNPHP